ncbi:MAG: 50S ribosomal protein L21 [Elusimicrobiota bacterium]|jgi:large subunit ribosomal protein L21|nr:50S ribosomal protein L21 [Elusimicrobiota bacterium]
MNYAIVKTGGKQYKVEEGVKLAVEKLDAEIGQEVIFDEVLLISKGDKTSVGTPTVSGATVAAKVIAQKRAPKILVFKRRPKKGYKKLQGHRQYLTEVSITKINAN